MVMPYAAISITCLPTPQTKQKNRTELVFSKQESNLVVTVNILKAVAIKVVGEPVLVEFHCCTLE